MTLTKAHKIHVSATTEALKRELDSDAPWLPMSATSAMRDAAIDITHAINHAGPLYGPASASRAIEAINRARTQLDQAEAYLVKGPEA